MQGQDQVQGQKQAEVGNIDNSEVPSQEAETWSEI